MGRTSLSTSIDASGANARYDKCVKRILSERIILAWILKGCAVEFRDVSVLEIARDCLEKEVYVSQIAVDPDELDYAEESVGGRVVGMNTEDVSIKEGKVFYDLRFSAIAPGTNESVHLIVNVEAQKES